MKLGKILLVIIILGAAYFALQQLGFLGSNLDKVRALDSKYGISEARLTPATAEEAEQYYTELRKINTTNSDEKNLIDLKASLATMGKEMLLFSEESANINLDSPNCSPSGPVVFASGHAQNSLTFAKSCSHNHICCFSGNARKRV